MAKLSGAEVIAIVCLVGAAAVAMTGNSGWGWLLFLAFIAMTS